MGNKKNQKNKKYSMHCFDIHDKCSLAFCKSSKETLQHSSTSEVLCQPASSSLSAISEGESGGHSATNNPSMLPT